MRISSPALRQRSAKLWLPQHVWSFLRSQSTSTSPIKPLDIGIIGGGINGMATAYWTLKAWERDFASTTTKEHIPPPKITIYEASDRMGGWVGTTKKYIEEGEDPAYIRFEHGPRTLATGWKSVPAMVMMKDLDILESVRWVRRTDAGARNRYIYHGEDGLYRVPTSLSEVGQDLGPNSKIQPILTHSISHFNTKTGIMNFKDSNRKMSLGELMGEMFGPEFVNFFLSGFVHGIYGGDVWRLDRNAEGPWSRLFWQTVQADQKRYEFSVFRLIKNMFFGKPTPPTPSELISKQLAAINRIRLEPWFKDWQNSFVFYLKEGLGLLPLALESWLRLNSSVAIETDTRITRVDVNAKGGPVVETKSSSGVQNAIQHDVVYSAVPVHESLKFVHPAPQIRAPAVSIGTVTLFWKDKYPVKYDGFGYIIAQQCPMERNPHGALGVIFDSDTRPAQDTAKGQKVTVLIGGHYWDAGIQKGLPLPNEDQLIAQAKETLEQHIGVTEEPDITLARVLHNCIPQPTTDFVADLVKHKQWALDEWGLKFALRGQPVIGPGVHDALLEGVQSGAKLALQNFEQLPEDVRAQLQPDMNELVKHKLSKARCWDFQDRTWLGPH